MRVCLFFLSMGVYFSAVAAQPVPEDSSPTKPWQIILQWDNDHSAGSDRDYTNGTRLAFLQELAPGTELDNALRRLLYPLTGAARSNLQSQWRFSGESEPRFAWGFGLSQLMFTPEDPDAPSAPKGERPYAGWLGLELSLHAKNDRFVSSVTLSLGTTGQPSYAGDIQTWIHRSLTDSPVNLSIG